MGISGVSSFPVWSGGFLNIFQLLRCRNLALNRGFSYFSLVVSMFYILGASRCPPICLDAPCMFRHPHAFGCPICSNNPPYVPNAPLCICMFWGYLHVIGGCGQSSFCLDSPHVFGCLPVCPTPSHSYMLPCMSVYSRGNCICYRGYSPYVGGSGASAHLSGFWCLSVHPLDVHYALSCTFLVVHYVSVSTSTTITTIPPVTVVSSGMSSPPLVTMAPSSMGLPTMLGQHDVVLQPPLTPRGFGGVFGHASVPQQQPPSSVPLQACANYAMGSPQVGFFFGVEPPTVLYIISLVSAFYFQVQCWVSYPPLGLNHWGLHHCILLEFTHGRHMWSLVMVISPHQICTEQLLPTHPIYMVGHTALGAWQRVTQSLCLPYMVGGVSFRFFVPSDEMVDSESAMGIKPGDFGVVIGY